MARGKLSLKLIQNEKTRATTLKKRLKGLKKKAYEFSILCDVPVCMIIYEPKLNDSPAKVETWPSDPNQVSTLIQKYHSKVSSDARNKNFNIFDFFNIKKRQVNDEVAQVRKANFKAKFPTWDDRIDNFTPEQIASLLTKLDLNLEIVRRKIMLMKEDHDQYNLVQFSKPKLDHPSDYNIAAFRSKNRNHIQAQDPLEFMNHFDHFQGFSREQNFISPSDEALVKLSLSLNSKDNSLTAIDKSLRMSMMSNIDFRVQPGIASTGSSNSNNNTNYSSMMNNVMYNHPPLVSLIHDHPRFRMSSNNLMFNSTSIPVFHDPNRSGPMQNNLMFHEPNKVAAALQQNCLCSPSLQQQTELVGYNQQQQQLMLPSVFPQNHQSQFSDFYHDMDDYNLTSKKPRF